jgi:hypothetical protein
MTLFVAATICTSLKAQTSVPEFSIDENTDLIAYEEKIAMGETPKSDLYDRAMKWAEDYFKNPTRVIREQDKDGGKIVCKASFNIHRVDKKGTKIKTGMINYSLKLWFKDGGYRIKLTEINLDQQSYFPIERWLNDKNYKDIEQNIQYLIDIDAFFVSLIDDLKENVENPEGEFDEDEW